MTRAEGVLVTGTVGAGKTTVAGHVGDLLAARRVAHAVVDLDGLRHAWPVPAGDPFNSAIELRNLASVAGNYRDAGIGRFVLAGVLERRGDLTAYERAVGGPVRVVRLVVPVELVRRRLRARHALDPGGLGWHLHRAGELDAVLDAARVADVDVAVGAREPLAVAADVVTAIGW